MVNNWGNLGGNMKQFKHKPINIKRFQNWCIDQGYDISSGERFTATKDGRLFLYFGNGWCNQKMLSLIDRYIKDKNK